MKNSSIMKKNDRNIVAIIREPVVDIALGEAHWKAFRFDTRIQDYVQNFLLAMFISSNEYFLVYEGDLKVSKKFPHHWQCQYNNGNTKWLNVYTTDVHVVPKKDGGCTYEIEH